MRLQNYLNALTQRKRQLWVDGTLIDTPEAARVLIVKHNNKLCYDGSPFAKNTIKSYRVYGKVPTFETLLEIARYLNLDVIEK